MHLCVTEEPENFIFIGLYLRTQALRIDQTAVLYVFLCDTGYIDGINDWEEEHDVIQLGGAWAGSSQFAGKVYTVVKLYITFKNYMNPIL